MYTWKHYGPCIVCTNRENNNDNYINNNNKYQAISS